MNPNPAALTPAAPHERRAELPKGMHDTEHAGTTPSLSLPAASL